MKGVEEGCPLPHKRRGRQARGARLLHPSGCGVATTTSASHLPLSRSSPFKELPFSEGHTPCSKSMRLSGLPSASSAQHSGLYFWVCLSFGDGFVHPLLSPTGVSSFHHLAMLPSPFGSPGPPLPCPETSFHIRVGKSLCDGVAHLLPILWGSASLSRPLYSVLTFLVGVTFPGSPVPISPLFGCRFQSSSSTFSPFWGARCFPSCLEEDFEALRTFQVAPLSALTVGL